MSSVETSSGLALNKLTVPLHISHLKPGNTLCANDNVLILQDGPTTIEIRTPPKFEVKKIPWRYGLIRDIVWCPEFGVFILLTQKALFTLNTKSFVSPPSALYNTDIQLTVNSYAKIKPFDEKSSFWRCTCAGTTVYISNSGNILFFYLEKQIRTDNLLTDREMSEADVQIGHRGYPPCFLTLLTGRNLE
jgi:hypothetical protein